MYNGYISNYKVSIETTKGGQTTITQGDYKADEQVNVSAITSLGYDWCGWYDGDILLSTSLNYTIVVPHRDSVYTAKWEIKPEMQKFEFVSSSNTCKITGVKDKNLIEVNIPSYVTDISGNTFLGCNNLESITVEQNNKNYSSQDGVLYNQEKTSLLYVPKAITGEFTINENVTEISEDAFIDRDRLISITISPRVRNIGNGAFASCDSLTNVYWNATSCLFQWEASSSRIFEDCTSLQTITIGEYVETIPAYAFWGCSVEQINWNAVNWNMYAEYFNGLFKDCKNLKTIIFGQNVKSIPKHIFQGCNNLSSVTISNNVTSIGYGAFQNCSGLTSITIPKSVKEIGDYSFNGCNLTSISFDGTIDEWNVIKKGSDWDMRTGDYIIHCTDGDIAKN